ncbi:MAG TPA: HAD-IB family hydrolase, partial [Ilumatobacteraceae bacterium]|nr:HAD-IB family hydrolase [Ilumatobacteraceae bacterium]
MARGAAFFDLDRTLIRRASGEVYGRAARQSGLVTRSIPGEGVLYGVFNLYGEMFPAMLLARQGARLSKGRRQADARRAGSIATDELLAMVEPGVAAVFDEHRRAGRLVVMATTTPYDLVKPFADRLGVDDLIATRYAVGDDGTYTGEFDGPFVWSTGKLAAVRDWSERHGIDLAHSYAYSDSVYDMPLLGAVGHPAVVNPDPRLIVAAALRKWPTVSFAGPPEPVDVQRIAMGLTSPLWFPYADFDIAGTERIPTEGPTILVANHRSYFDVAAVGIVLASQDRPVRFLGKREVFAAPVVGRLAETFGGIPVDRATGSAEPLRRAQEAIANGEIVGIMPQGTIPRGVAFFDPVLQARHGAARLARVTGASIVPVGLWGTEKVWPRSS